MEAKTQSCSQDGGEGADGFTGGGGGGGGSGDTQGLRLPTLFRPLTGGDGLEAAAAKLLPARQTVGVHAKESKSSVSPVQGGLPS